MVVVEKSSNPHSRRHRIFWSANFFTFEVCGLFDSRFDVEVDRRMAKESRRENRNTHEGGVTSTNHGDMVRERHFRDIEFSIMPHAPKNLLRLERKVV